MNAFHHLPEHWMDWLRTRSLKRTGTFSGLGSHDFRNETVSLRFPDGSHAAFRWAFAIADGSRGELAVLTEHCGYHVFPLTDTECEPAPEMLVSE